MRGPYRQHGYRSEYPPPPPSAPDLLDCPIEMSFWTKIATGLIAGAFGATVAVLFHILNNR